MKEEAQTEISFESCREEDKDVIIALLDDIGFDGFDESGHHLKAYIRKDRFDENVLRQVTEPYSLSYVIKEIQPQNWNAVWESHFDPVVIDDFVAVRAHFHQPIQNVQHEIVITPKMSFGTGHHATTTMMIQQMRSLNFIGKRVFDFGTGTGILAILAEKLGVKEIIAADNDEWSIENSRENIEQNHCRIIDVRYANTAVMNGTFDVILANINRNVILENFTVLNDQLNKNGYLLLSGLLAEDEAVILEVAATFGLVHNNTRHLGQWISLLFTR